MARSLAAPRGRPAAAEEPRGRTASAADPRSDRRAAAPRGRRALAAAALERSGLGALLRLAPTWRGVVALGYHRIGAPGDTPFDRAVFDATAEDFDAQVGFLARNFDVVGPGELSGSQSGRRVLITFDDGYRDNHAVALPILRAHGATATFFLTTGFLDRPRLAWWDEVAWMVAVSGRDRALIPVLLDRAKALPGGEREAFLDRLARDTGAGRAPAGVADGQWMTWDMARELMASGMDVGGHTVTHPILARLDAASQRAEILGCAARLEAELGVPMRWFSHPNGDRGSFDARTRAILGDASVELAFSFDGGFVRERVLDCFDVPRVAVGRRTAGPAFAATLTLPHVFNRPVPA
jgi:peptidoglycan/xylan/chitin deacetylase (PgdA/CDA1 family)